MILDSCHVILPSRTTDLRCGPEGRLQFAAFSHRMRSPSLIGRRKRTNERRAAPFHSTPQCLSPSDSCPCLPGLFFHSHSLVFTFSSQTSQDLPVIPFVPLLPGDRVETTEPLPELSRHPAAEHPLPTAAFGKPVKSCFLLKVTTLIASSG